MTPYRILAVNREDSQDVYVLSAQLSVDPKSGVRSIYILNKFIPGINADQLRMPEMGLTSAECKAIAHRQSNKYNSNILERYLVSKLWNNRYTLQRVILSRRNERITIPLEVEEYTQGDCLIVAMNDYCSRNNMMELEKL